MSYTYLKVFEKQVPLNNKYEDVVAFWKVNNGKSFLNNIDKHSFFSSYDTNYNNLNHYILLNFPLQDGLTTSVTLTREQVGSEFDSLLNKNYVHVVLDNNNIKDLYYFITDINYSKGRKLVSLSLELDVFSSFSEHLDLTKRPILAIRNSVNRFSNPNGCNEMLYTDDIDSKFSASILKDRKEIFNGNIDNLWAVVYCSSNAPIIRMNQSNNPQFRPMFVRKDNKTYLTYGYFYGFLNTDMSYSYYEKTEVPLNNDTEHTIIKHSIKAPYKVFVIPLTPKVIPIKQRISLYQVNSVGQNQSQYSYQTEVESTQNITYGFNIDEFFNLIQNNEYIYKVQVTTFDFLQYMIKTYGNEDGTLDLETLANTSYIHSLSSKQESSNNVSSTYTNDITINGRTYKYLSNESRNDTYYNSFLLGIKSFNENNITSLNKTYELYNQSHIMDEGLWQDLRETIKYEYGTRGNNSYQSKSIYLEPKLYVSPYTKYTYTSASESEYEFSPYLLQDGNLNCKIELSFTPTPSSSGETMFLRSGIYEHSKENYNGTSPISSLELTTTSQALQEFLTTQKNSYYTGLAQSYFNNAINIGGNYSAIFSNLVTETPTGALQNYVNNIKSIGDLYFIGEQNKSKMKDLASVPSKFSNIGFDILPIINNTNLSKYINCYTSLPNEYQQAYDYFYYYGYKTNEFRNAYKIVNSDTTMTYVYSSVEKNIFNRALFNYIRIGNNVDESIELNTNYDLDFIQKDKINEILHKGVRIWTPIKASDFLNFNFENMEADLI